MVIFRIFFNLLHMIIRVVFLPLQILMHNFFLVIILVAVIIIYHAFSTNPGPSPMIQPAPDPRVANPAAAPGMVEPVRRREDGDSAFATDLYASMSDPERNYYSNIFYTAMESTADNTPYVWNQGNIAGTITPTRTFTNNNGYSCRNFKEVLKVHAIEQTLSGVACPRPEGGWCKLKPNATPSCGLHTNGGGGLLGAIKGLF